jgi:hypothetical protein
MAGSGDRSTFAGKTAGHSWLRRVSGVPAKGTTLIKSEAFKFIVRGPPQELVVPLTVGVWVGLVTTAEVLPQPWPG